MSNMSYVRFENTLPDLRDCNEHLWDEGLSESEERARRRLKKLILEMAEEIQDNDGEEAQQ